MKKADHRLQGKTAIELLEEAVQLLRTASSATLACYYAGAIPFVLGLLYFWTEMSWSAFAERRLAEEALGMAMLFLWMKCCHAVFSRSLLAAITHTPAPPLGWRGVGRILVSQATLQTSGLFLLPISFVLALPFGWVYAFYQNLSALADGERNTKTLFREAWRQAAFWPRQNHLLLTLLGGFALCVFLNWIILCYMLPGLVKTLFGQESVFSRSGFNVLNTTFFMSMAGLTYLAVDPIVKAVYTLRCFYGLALKSGEDIKAELQTYAGSGVKAVVLAGCLLLASGTAWAATGESGPMLEEAPVAVTPTKTPGTGTAVSAGELGNQIKQVLEQRKYAWRLPRERLESAEQGPLGRFMEKVGRMLQKWAKALLDWIDSILRKLFRRQVQVAPSSSGYSWMVTMQMLLYVLAAAVIVALVLLVYRVWRKRGFPELAVASEPLRPAPDLTSEDLGADQLPEDGWMKLAREMMEKGELRLAVRALYLASLAHLADRNLVTLARSKSNCEYQRELSRRAHAFPILQEMFGENVSVFERIWYGMHEITSDLVTRFETNVRRIKEGSA